MPQQVQWARWVRLVQYHPSDQSLQPDQYHPSARWVQRAQCHQSPQSVPDFLVVQLLLLVQLLPLVQQVQLALYLPEDL